MECEAWATGAETIARHFKKGDPIIIHCSAKTETWEDKNGGGQRSRIKFRVNEFDFPMGKRREDSVNSEETQPQASAPIDSEDDIPF